ncbi:AI-2E family transporter [Craurococcus roseus]|uniref:AI-2E family transporter n=1 Tax=Craurococcus roseus TaxID=77585 RepID=A0ABN1ENP8_9PROT
MPLPPAPKRRGLSAAMPGSRLEMLQVGAIVVATLYFARDMLIPIALAVLLSFVLAPLVRALGRFYVPRVAGVLLVVALGFGLILGIGAVMGRQATSLAANLPAYKATVAEKLQGLHGAGGVLDRMTGVLHELGTAAAPPNGPADGPPGDAPRPDTPAGALRTAPGGVGDPSRPVPVEIRSPDPTAFEMLQRVAEPLLEPLATVGIVVVLVIFILLYREDLRDRMIRLAGARDLHRTLAAMDDAAYRLSRYFLAQVGLNSGFGLFIAAGLWLIGIPNPLLWGFIAGLMRFVPFIGAYIAAAFPMMLALAVGPGWSSALWVLALFAVSEPLMGHVLEPWIFGHSTGLSPVAVIGAAAFWTWLWGSIGLLLAVPLTVCLVVLGRHVEQLEFLEVMLGDQPPLDPEEAFYQRALAGDEDALAEQAEACLREQRLPQYLDAVALPALALAQADAARGALTPERRERLERSVVTLLEDIEEADEGVAAKAAKEAAKAAAAVNGGKEDAPTDEGEEGGTAPPAPGPVPARWQARGAVLCSSGRGAFDPLLATMVGQALARRGFGVQIGGRGAPLAGAPPLLLCLCFVEGGASAAAARYLLRRARRQHPGIATLALAWSPEEDGALAAALEAEGHTEPVLLARNVAEAVELVVETACADAAEEPAPPAEARAAAAAAAAEAAAGSDPSVLGGAPAVA